MDFNGIDVEGPGIGGSILIQGNHIHLDGRINRSVISNLELTTTLLLKPITPLKMCAICIFLYEENLRTKIPDKKFCH